MIRSDSKILQVLSIVFEKKGYKSYQYIQKFLSRKIKIQPATIVETQHIIDVKLTRFFFDKGNILISKKIPITSGLRTNAVP
jgi:hypothetical protein